MTTPGELYLSDVKVSPRSDESSNESTITIRALSGSNNEDLGFPAHCFPNEPVQAWDLSLQATCLAVICLVGVFANSTFLCAFFNFYRASLEKHPLSVLIVNLSITDLFSSAITQPYIIVSIILQRPPLGMTVCAVHYVTFALMYQVSTHTLASIAVYNYFLITKSQFTFHKRVSKRRCIATCVLIWLIDVTMIVIMANVGITDIIKYDATFNMCGPDPLFTPPILSLVYVLHLHIIPFSVMTFCYVGIFLKLKVGRVICCEKVRINTQPSLTECSRIARNKKVSKNSFLILVTFLSCIFLNLIGNLFEVQCFTFPYTFHKIGVFLLMANTAINPFVYMWRNRRYTGAIKAVLTCKIRHYKLHLSGVPRNRQERPIYLIPSDAADSVIMQRNRERMARHVNTATTSFDHRIGAVVNESEGNIQSRGHSSRQETRPSHVTSGEAPQNIFYPNRPEKTFLPSVEP